MDDRWNCGIVPAAKSTELLCGNPAFLSVGVGKVRRDQLKSGHRENHSLPFISNSALYVMV